MKKIYLVIILSISISSIIIYSDFYLNKIRVGDNAEVVTIKMYRSPWPGFMLIELANKLGYFKEEGIKISHVEIQTTEQMYKMLNDGSLDAISEVVANLYSKTFNEEKATVQVVMVTDYSNGADAIIKRKDSPSLFDDTPKTFAGENDYKFFVPYALDKMRANIKSIKYINIPDDVDKVNKLLEGRVDYIVSYEPYLTKAIESGALVVYSSGDEPGTILDGVMFSKNFIDKYPDIINGFVRAYFKAYNTWKSSPEETYKLVSDFLETTPEEVERNMSKIEMLSLSDNVGSMSTKQGLTSIYNNLQEAQFYENKRGGINGLRVRDMVYPDAIRKIKRENDLN